MADINYVFFLSLVIIIIGYAIKKLGIIKEENGKVIAKIVLNFTLPALVLQTFANIQIDLTLLFLPLICIVYNLILLGSGFLIFGRNPRNARGLFLMSILGFNIGLFAYPLIRGVWGQVGLHFIAMFDMGNAFVIFGLSYALGSYYSPQHESLNDKESNFKIVGKKLIKSVPLLSIIFALIINLSGVVFPIFISDLLDIISAANRPLTMLLLGIYLNFQLEKSQWKSMLKVIGIRYGFGLSLGVLMFFLLPFDLLFRQILLIGLILPIGMSFIPFTVEFGYDDKLAGILTNITIIISFGLMWGMTLLMNRI